MVHLMYKNSDILSMAEMYPKNRSKKQMVMVVLIG